LIGSIVLLRERALDTPTVIYACKYSISGAFLAGCLGLFIGRILESSNPRKNLYKPAKKSRPPQTKENSQES